MPAERVLRSLKPAGSMMNKVSRMSKIVGVGSGATNVRTTFSASTACALFTAAKHVAHVLAASWIFALLQVLDDIVSGQDLAAVELHALTQSEGDGGIVVGDLPARGKTWKRLQTGVKADERVVQARCHAVVLDGAETGIEGGDIGANADGERASRFGRTSCCALGRRRRAARGTCAKHHQGNRCRHRESTERRSVLLTRHTRPTSPSVLHCRSRTSPLRHHSTNRRMSPSVTRTLYQASA